MGLWHSAGDQLNLKTLVIMMAVVLLGGASSALAQDTLPEGAGKEPTLRLCGTCHEAAKATSVKLTREGWVDTITRMKAFGAAGPDEDFGAVLEYLVNHFRGETVEALDMNSAESIDLESVLQLLRRESRAVLEYRAKRGPFSSLDDLKGLDPAIFRKIEAKKDRIAFQTQSKK
jgi:DNA uptake protein ComE-like DNA-binding protein